MTKTRLTSLFWILLLVILFSVFARAWLSMELLFRDPGTPDLRVLWRWGGIEGLAGWLGMLILASVDQAYLGAGKRIVPWLLGAGVAVACAATLTLEARGSLEFAAAVMLALGALVLGLRQISQVTLRHDQSSGVTIDQLWRLLAVQWMLVWISAEVFLRWRFRNFVLDDGGKRLMVERLLFGLAAFGFLPNVLFAAGLTWWPKTRAGNPPARPSRPRAWLVSLVLFNLGAIGLVATCIGVRWTGALGFAAANFAVILYFTGFGKDAWKGGMLVPLSWLAFLIGIFVFLLGSSRDPLSATDMAAQLQYTAGWRSLVGCAFPLLWLIGFAGLAARAFIPAKFQAIQASAVAKVLVVLGVVVIAATLAAGHASLPAVSSGTLLLLAGATLAAALIARALRAARL